jgi:hypothetical protein
MGIHANAQAAGGKIAQEENASGPQRFVSDQF